MAKAFPLEDQGATPDLLAAVNQCDPIALGTQAQRG